MFNKIKSMFKKEPINTMTTKEVDDFYVEHTITKAVNVAGKDVIEVEKIIQTKPEIIERATKAINDQNKEELEKALVKPFKGVPDQVPLINEKNTQPSPIISNYKNSPTWGFFCKKR